MNRTKTMKLIPQEYVEAEGHSDNLMLSAFFGRECMLLMSQTMDKDTCDLPQTVVLRCDDGRPAGPIDITITLQVDSPLTRSKRTREEGNVQ